MVPQEPMGQKKQPASLEEAFWSHWNVQLGMLCASSLQMKGWLQVRKLQLEKLVSPRSGQRNTDILTVHGCWNNVLWDDPEPP